MKKAEVRGNYGEGRDNRQGMPRSIDTADSWKMSPARTHFAASWKWADNESIADKWRGSMLTAIGICIAIKGQPSSRAGAVDENPRHSSTTCQYTMTIPWGTPRGKPRRY